jgi:hypothetical protein
MQDQQRQPLPQQPERCPQRNQQEHKMAKHNVSLYRAMHHLRKGGLHKALGVPQGQSIPAEKMEHAKNSSNEHVRHMANFAATMSHFKH